MLVVEVVGAVLGTSSFLICSWSSQELHSLPLRVQTRSPPPPPPLAHVLEALAAGGRGGSRHLEFYSLASSLNLKTYFEIFQTVQLKE